MESDHAATPLGEDELFAGGLRNLANKVRKWKKRKYTALLVILLPVMLDLLAPWIKFILVFVGGVSAVLAVKWNYGDENDVRIAALIVYATAIGWALLEQQEARSRKAAYALIRDFATCAHKGIHRTKEDALYKHMVDLYLLSSPSGKSLLAIKLSSILAKKSFDATLLLAISCHYRSAEERARDYLCVIFANDKTRFLEGNLVDWVRYFGSFRRAEKPRNRLTRVFSVPVDFCSSLPVWNKAGALSKAKRKQLFALLWLNDAVGVDTKLHLFDSTRSECQDFFQSVDYVICHDPVCNIPEERFVVFLLKPDDETETVQLFSDDLYSLFHCEFYQRLAGQPIGTEQAEIIIEVCWRKYEPIKVALDLTADECASAVDELIKCTKTLEDNELSVSPDLWNSKFTEELSGRWNWWVNPSKLRSGASATAIS